MKDRLSALIREALERLGEDVVAPEDIPAAPHVERTRDASHGDLATNVALTLAKATRRKPRELAQLIVDALPESGQISKVEIAGPGFINFHLAQAATFEVVRRVLEQTDAFGRSDHGDGRRVIVEFVSANPTGPLHVGHGRGAAFGASLANLLEATGHAVHREYYVNDAGRQMDILALSVWLRYLERCGEAIEFPSQGYRGTYVGDIAGRLREAHGTRLCQPAAIVMDDIPADAPYGEAEERLDALILRARELLGSEDYAQVHRIALDAMLEDIRQDLSEFGVEFDRWFSERSLADGGRIDDALARLAENGHLYKKGGARWFRASAFGDDKDRVVERENGQRTYIASDIAYHLDKCARGFDVLLDVLGADHHGYVARVRAGLEAMGERGERLDVPFVQFVSLYRGGTKMQMSTRSGEFVTLRQLRAEVGNDAARFFYIMRSIDQHLDFDLELAKSQSNDNPVYYVQYAHARVCSVFRQLEEQGLSWDSERASQQLDQLTEAHERALLDSLARFPETLVSAAERRAPHLLAQYLRTLANEFHTYYNAHKFLVETSEVRDARLALIEATRQVIENGLTLLGVSAPRTM